ncbi:MAG: transglycosylase SLT domain-containing protein [bacterium]|nr:transglycosylase SLT domain-containing protein [bacterium]
MSKLAEQKTVSTAATDTGMKHAPADRQELQQKLRTAPDIYVTKYPHNAAELASKFSANGWAKGISKKDLESAVALFSPSGDGSFPPESKIPVNRIVSIASSASSHLYTPPEGATYYDAARAMAIAKIIPCNEKSLHTTATKLQNVYGSNLRRDLQINLDYACKATLGSEASVQPSSAKTKGTLSEDKKQAKTTTSTRNERPSNSTIKTASLTPEEYLQGKTNNATPRERKLMISALLSIERSKQQFADTHYKIKKNDSPDKIAEKLQSFAPEALKGVRKDSLSKAISDYSKEHLGGTFNPGDKIHMPELVQSAARDSVRYYREELKKLHPIPDWHKIPSFIPSSNDEKNSFISHVIPPEDVKSWARDISKHLSEDGIKVPKAHLTSLVIQESNGRVFAISPAKAIGIAQIKEDTAKEIYEQTYGRDTFNKNLLYNPKVCMELGGRYLASLHQQKHDWHEAFRHYNIGPNSDPKKQPFGEIYATEIEQRIKDIKKGKL